MKKITQFDDYIKNRTKKLVHVVKLLAEAAISIRREKQTEEHSLI
jgi:hypothetical protein